MASRGTSGLSIEDPFQILCPKSSVAFLVPLTFVNLKLSQLMKQHVEHYFDAGFFF